MKNIETKDTVKDIRTLDRAASIVGRMKSTFIRTKEQAEQTQQANTDSPVGYAEDRATESARSITREASYKLHHQGKLFAEKTRKKIKKPHLHEKTPEPEQTAAKEESTKVTAKTAATEEPASSYELYVPDYATLGRNSARGSASRRTEHTGSDYAEKETRRGVNMVKRGVKQNAYTSDNIIRTGSKGSIKTVERSIKTSELTSRATIKTTQATVKKTVKTAQVTGRTAQRSAQAVKETAKTTASAAKTLGKSVVTTVKAMIDAARNLIAAIAAGGWVAVVVIIIVLLAASILGSVFGIFASKEGYDGVPSMPEVVCQLNKEFSSKINSIIDSNPHDKLVIDNAGSASMVANWNEVLAVYDVLVATNPESPIEVATLDSTKIDKLKMVFWDMNSISYSVNEVAVGTNELTGESITETVLTITVRYKSVNEMIFYYGFSTERAAQVWELLKPEYAELFQQLTGSYKDITLSASEIATIMETLPNGLSEARKEVVLTAYSLIGKVNYFWGGKSLVLGWDSRWGTPMKVTAEDDPTTGTVHPFGLDCSGFVDWVFNNAYGGKYIIGQGGGAESQYSFCMPISWSDAQSGDLVFYPNCEHVGIVVKNEDGTPTIIHCASGYNNVVMTRHTQGDGFAFVGRPQIYDK